MEVQAAPAPAPAPSPATQGISGTWKVVSLVCTPTAWAVPPDEPHAFYCAPATPVCARRDTPLEIDANGQFAYEPGMGADGCYFYSGLTLVISDDIGHDAPGVPSNCTAPGESGPWSVAATHPIDEPGRTWLNVQELNFAWGSSAGNPMQFSFSSGTLGYTALDLEVCGLSSTITCTAIGSPPRVWGQCLLSGGRAVLVRFTPTCVGTMAAAASGGSSRTVHPHVCGDNAIYEDRMMGAYGSPPRVWGQSPAGRLSTIYARFTPTCVGTMKLLPPSTSKSTVHPHVCGDNVIEAMPAVPFHGSPPRVWGQFPLRVEFLRDDRFTPTCVGTIHANLSSYILLSVHPHVCGDNEIFTGDQQLITGSPPRVWGQCGHRQTDFLESRFTPTCVGTISGSGAATDCRYGSPPRVWGQLFMFRVFMSSHRFTPTCVGTISSVAP